MGGLVEPARSMRRRARVAGATVLAGLLLAASGPLPGDPGPAAAQPAGRVARIGFLSPMTGPYIGSPATVYDALRQGLRDLGWVEGRNVTFEYRFAADRDGLDALAAELVRAKVDVLVAAGTASYAARKATGTVPIVFGFSGDPIDAGFVQSFARPGGNMTGLSHLAREMMEKRVDLLKQAAPAISRVAVLNFPDHSGARREWTTTAETAQRLGLGVQRLDVRAAEDIDRAFEAMARERADAVLAFPDGVTMAHRARIAELCVRRRLPSVFGWHEYAEAGGLMSYGPNRDASWRHAATFVDRILKGARPGDLPVEQPTRVELVLNLRTARALGLSIPPALLVRADRVIQ